MRLRIFFKYYSLVFALLSAGMTVKEIISHRYGWAIFYLACTFINHIAYNSHKEELKNYNNEKDNSENPS